MTVLRSVEAVCCSMQGPVKVNVDAEKQAQGSAMQVMQRTSMHLDILIETLTARGISRRAATGLQSIAQSSA